MLSPMTRSIPLTENATWWPSTLFQTTTLELRRDGQRLLVDPGISLAEIDEVVAARPEPVTDVLLTHADWDHVMGVGVLPDARVTAGRGTLDRIESGQAQASVEKESAEFYIDYAALDRLRVDQVVDTPAEISMGPWNTLCRPGKGHTDDGIVTSFLEDELLVVGDYLSAIEIPWAYSSVLDYRDTVRMLIGVIERERPRFVVGGHGRAEHHRTGPRHRRRRPRLSRIAGELRRGGMPSRAGRSDRRARARCRHLRRSGTRGERQAGLRDGPRVGSRLIPRALLPITRTCCVPLPA